MTWRTNYEELFKAVTECVKEQDWMWIRNGEFKYINIRMDMRDGGYILFDRNKNPSDIAGLKFQYTRDHDKEPKTEAITEYKVVAVSDADRDNVDDVLVCDSIREKVVAEKIAAMLNQTAHIYAYKVVESDYKLYKWEP